MGLPDEQTTPATRRGKVTTRTCARGSITLRFEYVVDEEAALAAVRYILYSVGNNTDAGEVKRVESDEAEEAVRPPSSQ